jgi:hypothetical protein
VVLYPERVPVCKYALVTSPDRSGCSVRLSVATLRFRWLVLRTGVSFIRLL